VISRVEAFLIFDKLYSEKSVVACVGSLFGWKLTARGRISALSEKQVTFISLDKQAGIVLRLDLDDLVFEYAEPKDLPPSEVAEIPPAARNAAALAIGLPVRVSPSDLADPTFVPIREKLTFVEIPQGSE
jgi:hypothetical protein